MKGRTGFLYITFSNVSQAKKAILSTVFISKMQRVKHNNFTYVYTYI